MQEEEAKGCKGCGDKSCPAEGTQKDKEDKCHSDKKHKEGGQVVQKQQGHGSGGVGQKDKQEGGGKPVEGSEDESGERSEDDCMDEALADYAAARDTVLKTAKKELGEVVR